LKFNLIMQVERDFDVKEVFEAIRMYVLNFFGCKECAENFASETEDYERYFKKPYDAVNYLWKSRLTFT
jgi:hypothetical protein